MSRDQAYYDARWSTPVTELGPVGRQRVLVLRQTLAEVRKRVGRDLRILDFGCGQGHYAAIAADFGNVLAIDLSPVAIQHGRASYPHVEFRVGDVLKCDLPGPFDVVLSIEVLEHVRDQLLYITCLASLLAAGGHLILTTPNRAVAKRYWSIEAHREKAQPVEAWLSISDVRKLLSPWLDTVYAGTVGTGYSYKGIMRLVNSAKIDSMLAILGLRGTVRRAWELAGYGLHIFLHAVKPLDVGTATGLPKGNSRDAHTPHLR